MYTSVGVLSEGRTLIFVGTDIKPFDVAVTTVLRAEGTDETAYRAKMFRNLVVFTKRLSFYNADV